MEPEEAHASGAHVGDVDPAELSSHEVNGKHRATSYEEVQIPGGGTNGLWYLAAYHLVPKTMNHTDRLRWIEGFVSALELVRGVNVTVTDVSDVLRETISMQPNVEDLLG